MRQQSLVLIQELETLKATPSSQIQTLNSKNKNSVVFDFVVS